MNVIDLAEKKRTRNLLEEVRLAIAFLRRAEGVLEDGPDDMVREAARDVLRALDGLRQGLSPYVRSRKEAMRAAHARRARAEERERADYMLAVLAWEVRRRHPRMSAAAVARKLARDIERRCTDRWERRISRLLNSPPFLPPEPLNSKPRTL